MVSFIGRKLALVLALSVLWLLLSGFFDHATLLAFGVASVLLSVWLSHRAGMLDAEGVPTKVFPGIVGYMIWLTVEIGKANIIVAREVFRPKLALSPQMIRVPATQKSDLTRTIFGNSITLTPGTVTVDIDEDQVLIHALTEDLADEAAIADMGARVCALEDESADALSKEKAA